jgi:AraC-like DNA-binding protein
VVIFVHKPSPPLDRFVELVTYFEDYQPAHRVEKVLPDGAVEIIIDLSEGTKKLYDQDNPNLCKDFRSSWISGMRRRWILIEAQPGASLAVIRFRPGGARPFLGFDADGITETIAHLDEVLGTRVRDLRERVLERRGARGRIAAIEDWLLERGGGALDANPVVDYLTSRLFAPAGLRISDLVEEVGYTQRHVAALFRRWVGLSPKQYARVRRFNSLVLHATGTPESEPDWADLALEYGYFDQSHMIHEFREFSGLTPESYLERYRGLANYLPVR